MTIGTIRLNQQNAELFAELNKKLENIQSQVGSGKADLKLSENLHEISKLSASEEKKLEAEQYIKNANRAKTDLEVLDVALERLQNLIVRFQELAVESANGTMSSSDRERYIIEANMIKEEFFHVSNQTDSFGNALFGGVSGLEKPFSMDFNGFVSYDGSAIMRTVQVADGLKVQQNYAGNEVFNNIGDTQEGFSVFEMIDDFVESLKVDLTSNKSSNLISDGNSVDLVFPNTGLKSEVSFKLTSDGLESELSSTIYGNDYSSLVSEINSITGVTGVSASMVSTNRIRLNSAGENLTIDNFGISNFDASVSKIDVIKDTSSDTVNEEITEIRLQNDLIRSKITEAFEHFSTKRAEVGAAARRADESVRSNQDILMMIEEKISDLKDADLATLLTQLEFLMTNKEAAQATFTRITSKSLFDFLS